MAGMEEEIKLRMKRDRKCTYNIILKWRFRYFICEINEWDGHGFASMATSVCSRQWRRQVLYKSHLGPLIFYYFNRN